MSRLLRSSGVEIRMVAVWEDHKRTAIAEKTSLSARGQSSFPCRLPAHPE